MSSGNPISTDRLRSAPKQQGFTLLEAMIVCVIIAILATLAVGGYRQTVIHAREAALHGDLDVMRRSINEYIHDKEAPPDSLQSLVDSHYIGSIPVDPITKRDDWDTEECPVDEYFDSDQTSAAGICDVHSSSQDVSPFENIPYSQF
ncbi:MAG TPA: type II secretion system protein [Candidatus Aquilonibacter sp.]|nr:type II secretion system protein [Candidatus Aquilonibacter sp.]